MAHYRIGIDTGGTFTDVALIHEQAGTLAITKVPSTPDNPARAVMDGVAAILAREKIHARDIQLFLHGTTVATNVLLEKKGAKTALITTEGFRDVLEIGRQTRPKLYDFRAQRPQPLVPRSRRLEVAERIAHTGEVLRPLDAQSVEVALEQIASADVDAVAVCLLNSYANAEHERQLRKRLQAKFPHVYVSLSSDVLPEMKEYERTSTVAANAYVVPVMDRYLSHLEERLKDAGIPSPLYVMLSSGGVAAAEEARRAAAHTALSGPVGGVMAGVQTGRETGHANVMTLDMGGTSLDVSLIENGEPHTTSEADIAGFPITLPMLDIHTIGAGGGSLAWIDSGGALRVGPQSAGAVPGPVCYGTGGEQPTVTDAHAVLGRLNPAGLLGGEMALDVAAARAAIRGKIADPLRMTVEEAARGILQVVNANMIRGMRAVSVERGRNPRDFALVAFGGAGPLHASELADLLGMPEVIIPPSPGIASAVGMVNADVRHDAVRACLQRAEEADLETIRALLKEMADRVRRVLLREGFDERRQRVSYWADLRYQHQSYDIRVPLPAAALDRTSWQAAIERFHEEHERRYGYRREEEPVEVVHVRVTVRGLLPPLKQAAWPEREAGRPEPAGERPVFWEDRWIATPVYRRETLRAGDVLEGPLILEQLDSTTVVSPQQTAKVDEYGNVRLTFDAGGMRSEN